MPLIVDKVRQELEAKADEKAKNSTRRFFKENVMVYGVKTAVVRKIAKKHWNEVKVLGKEKIFALCEELYRSDYTEEAFVASFWLQNLVERLEPSDLEVFKAWIEKYISNEI